ncbi:ABC transporter permease [Pseudooceanicola nanhaiensis]|uniref:ABC transporter permease n=1 Tax=Pseudooceanicola nanhaiensis TaxID=375761 RepID=UPI001CD50DEB|nr:ABC transporter permease [Pseudooceanicola nanhaiensis]MCA0920881.1 ABC transporter permease [Pseudooceanicola nanhaiensis]
MNSDRFLLPAPVEALLWKLGRLLFHVVGLAWQLFMVAPLIIVVVVSFTSASYLMFPPPGYSLDWYREVLSLSWIRSAVTSSLIIATCATLIAVVIGVLASRVLAKRPFRGRGLVEYLVLSPLFLPGVVIGFAIFNVLVMIQMDRVAMPQMIIAHVMITLPFVIRSVWASMAGADISLEEAAQSLGATPAQTFWHVVLKSARPGILAGAILAFTFSFNDVTISIFLTSSRVTTLPVQLVSHIEYNPDPSPAAISTLMIAITLALFVFLARIGGLNAFLER